MSGIADLIEELASSKAGVREAAVEAVHREGKHLGEQAVGLWRSDAEMARLLVERAPTAGIAVLPENFTRIHKAFGSPRLADVPADQDALEFELHVAGASLDILTVRSRDESPGAISRFLAKFGEGIQQVEYLVGDVDRATEILRSRFGLPAIYPATRAGADNTRVNFFLCGTAGGKKVLIELVESRQPHR